MPRKSKTLRLQQTKELISAYEKSGVSGTPLTFMKDMYSSMSKEKYPSKRQRDWLDRLIDEGVPTPKEPSATYVKMQKARDIFLNEAKHWEAKVLGDFMHRETKGWSLSEKQVALLSRLLEQAITVEAGEHKLILADVERADLEAACKLWQGYSSVWRSERPALSRARTQCLEYLSGSSYIEQYHYDKVTTAVASKLKAFKNSRFNAGDMGFTDSGSTKKVWICTSCAYINDKGMIVNDWIDPNGLAATKSQEKIGKR